LDLRYLPPFPTRRSSDLDISLGQPMPRWRILLTLHQMGEISQKQLACELRMDPAALTRQLKSIAQLGWIERNVDALDNRLTNVRSEEHTSELQSRENLVC